LAGSQLHAETLVADTRPYLPLISAPIKGAKRTIVILSLALAGCRGPVAPINPTSDVISFHFYADNATAPLLRELTHAYHPGRLLVTTDIKIAETKAVLGLLNNSAQSYALLNYLPDQFDAKLWVTPIGTDSITIVVNPANPITNLTAAQLRSILQGRVSNWQALGGANLPVTLVALDTDSTASMLVQSMVLGDRRISRAARLAPTMESAVEIVGNDPGAISYVSMGYVNTVVRTVALDDVMPTSENVTAHRYPIYTPLVFVGGNEPGNDTYRAFFAWVQSPEGQSIVRRHYGGIGSR
jgi:hypothetical protein